MADDALFDTFTDTNGTALESHTPEIGGSWSVSTAGKMTIQSNALKQTTFFVADNIWSVMDGGTDQGVISFDFTPPGSGTWALLALFRSTSNHSSFYGMRLANDTAGSDGNGKYLLDQTFAYIQGVSPTSLTISNGVTYHLDCFLTPNNELTVNLNGTTILHRTGLSKTGQNYWGIVHYLDNVTYVNSVTFDNFAVSPLWRPMMFGLRGKPLPPPPPFGLSSAGAYLDTPSPPVVPDWVPLGLPRALAARQRTLPRRDYLPATPTIPGATPPLPPSNLPGLVPFDSRLEPRERKHQQHVSAILNSLLRQGLLKQTAPDEFTLGFNATAADWAATAPVTVSAALDRLAALVKTLNGGTGA